ncbi:MAG: hypothetical protein ACFFEY_02520 [Candidatus Thorarchaeota archaeon]
MDKTKSAIRLLALFTIYFVYRAIMGAIENNSIEIILWSMITVIYVVSLIIMYIVANRWEKNQNM